MCLREKSGVTHCVYVCVNVPREQSEVEELCETHCRGRLGQHEVEALFTRFRDLDRDHKGYLTPAQLQLIPEIALNPLAPRLLARFENVNFVDFCVLLSYFSKNATREDQVQFIFSIFDTDGDGRVTKRDLLQMLQLLAGSFLSETEKEELVERYDARVLERVCRSHAVK